MKKTLSFFCLVFLSFLRLEASHIVGAELHYNCLGNDNYAITLMEYRNCGSDCFTCAPYSNTEYVQIFDSLGNYIQAVGMRFPSSDTLTNGDSAHCFSSLGYCVELAVYQATVSLPPIAGGYILVYQRCCRNSAIVNIQQESGATYYAYITNCQICNSTPRFKKMTPSINSIDTAFAFDMSASDPDNDSLVYRLVSVLDGASSSCPDPSPNGNGSGGCPTSASPPPYLSVPYIAPYSANNPTNNPLDSGHLRIDPVTGLLSGVVNQTGLFVVAVAADEYRNGLHLGTTYMDYQFLFGSCQSVNSITDILSNEKVRIYNDGIKAIISFTGSNSPTCLISFYDVLGQKLAEDNNFSGNIYYREFTNISPQYLIAKVQLSTGETFIKKLYIGN